VGLLTNLIDRLLSRQCLAELCEKLGFEFFLAELEREVNGNCDGEDNDEGAWENMYWRSVHNQEPKIHTITDIENQWLYLSHNVVADAQIAFSLILS
jgi:hypothetical protein